MDNFSASPQPVKRSLRDWIDPTRIYNQTLPVARWPFVWGLAIYPFLVLFFFLSVIIAVVETVYSAANVPDYIGIISYIFMLGWVWAAVSISLRRMRTLGMRYRWIWLTILPIGNLFFFVYLVLKSAPVDARQVA